MKCLGFVLYPLLIVFSLAGIALSMSWQSILAVENSSLLLHALRARENAGNEALLSGRPSRAAGSAISCSKGTSEIGKVHLERTLCFRSNEDGLAVLMQGLIEGPVLRSKFPQFDYQLLFKQPQRCPETATPDQVSPASTPSPGAQMQLSTCLNFTPQPQATLRENLKLEGDTVVDASIKLLGSVGYIEAQSTLTLSGDILIVAGGDLFIEALQSAGSPLNATLVSATGAVLVHTLDPQIRLRVIAWQGAFVPSHLTHQASSLMPPILEKQILGFLPRQNR